MKRSILACVGSVLMSLLSPALAADLPVKAGPIPPYIAPFYNWSGFYLGISGGYGFGTSRWTDPAAATTTGDFDISGGLIGATLGYNFQTGAIVWGIEGDISWSDIKGSTTNLCPGGCETKNNWLGTTRFRIGYAFDRWLPFLTAGAAFGDIKASSPLGSSSTTKIGWAVGGGLEFAIFNNWTAKAEYLYVDLDSGTCTGFCSPGGPIDVKFQSHVIRGGINYRF